MLTIFSWRYKDQKPDPDPGGPKIYGYDGAGSATLSASKSREARFLILVNFLAP
jgi:hypothetical protein